MNRCLAFGLLLLSSAAAVSAESPAANGGEKGKWVELNKGVDVDVKKKDGTTEKKPGGISGVCVDRASGDVFAFFNGAGLKKSTDQGKTFSAYRDCPQGGCGGPDALVIDPENGKRMACFLGSGPSALTLDGGATWLPIKHNGYCLAVDWGDPEAKTMAGRRGGHDAYSFSKDQGKSWTPWTQEWPELGGAFDAKTIVRGSGRGLELSEDAGATWKTASDEKIKCAVLYVFKGAGYITRPGLLASTDKGKTWTKRGDLPQGFIMSLLFGKDEKHLAVSVKESGIYESKDGGQTWTKVIDAFPVDPKLWREGWNHVGWASVAWDPARDIYYFGAPGHPLFKYQR